MSDEKLFKGSGIPTQDGYVPVKEGYQPQPGKLEKGYQPAKQSECPPANLKIPSFETGIQTPVTSNVPAKDDGK
jgi:hypothetical protein